MPATPEMGQGKGVPARPNENTRIVTRSQTNKQQPKNYQADFPALQEADEPQHTPPAKPPGENRPTNTVESPKAKPVKPLPALHKIAKMIEQIITKHNPPGQVKQALTEVLELAKKAAEEDKGTAIHIPLN